MTPQTNLKVIIIAGPNGAGKTTFAREFLPNEAACQTFVNADLIAAGLAPFAPETAALQAGRLMLTELDRHFSQRQSFAFETTLSGRAYANAIRRWQAAGYKVELIFLKLHDAEEAIARVTQRVLQGGHHIPDEVVRRRFEQGLKNLVQIYKPLVNAWAVYDNSGEVPQLIEWSEKMKPQLPIEQARNSDLRGSAAALARAAQRAREVAMRTQTALVVRRNGVLVHDRIIDTTGTPVTPGKA